MLDVFSVTNTHYVNSTAILNVFCDVLETLCVCIFSYLPACLLGSAHVPDMYMKCELIDLQAWEF